MPDLAGTAAAVDALAAAGVATREPIGYDAVWRATAAVSPRASE